MITPDLYERSVDVACAQARARMPSRKGIMVT
jgi:hypothetical protein